MHGPVSRYVRGQKVDCVAVQLLRWVVYSCCLDSSLVLNHDIDPTGGSQIRMKVPKCLVRVSVRYAHGHSVPVKWCS